MTKIILIGSGGLAATLASLQAQGQAVSVASERDSAPEDHSVAGMLEGLRAARAEREERTVADYGMEQVNALFAEIFGHAIDDQVAPYCEIEFMDADDAALYYGTQTEGPEFPGLLTMLDLINEDDLVPLTEEELDDAEQQCYAKAYDALMKMLDVFAFVSGTPVTPEQRVTMTMLLACDETAEAFATAAEDLIGSGLFE